MTHSIEMTDRRFERLLVVGKAEKRKGQLRWNCICDCGNEAVVVGWRLRNGKTRSCGCLQKETIGNIRRTHGMRTRPEYYIWVTMKGRCKNPNNSKYENYGGRGISVCVDWEKFENFYADMGDRPSPKHTIDRIDNDGDYEPTNCRWATGIQQARNRRVRRGSKSGITGVIRVGNKWRASIKFENKNIHLYQGNDFFEACCRRKSAENKYWGVNR